MAVTPGRELGKNGLEDKKKKKRGKDVYLEPIDSVLSFKQLEGKASYTESYLLR